MENQTQNFFNQALAAAGPCGMNDDMNAYFLHVRTLAARIVEEQEKMGAFLDKYHRALNGGKKNGNDGYHNFEAIISKVYIDEKKANRAFIEYLEANNEGQMVPAKRPLRTAPTSDPEALALYQKLESLIGHKVRLFKWPEPVQGNVTVKTEFGEQQVSSVAVIFHVVDLGAVEKNPTGGQNTTTRPPQANNQTSQNQQAPQNNAAPNQNTNNQQPPAFKTVNEAKKALFKGLKNAYPNAPQNALAESAAAGWASIGNPAVSPTADGMNQAMTAATAHLNQLAQNQAA